VRPLRIAAIGLRGLPSGYSGLERAAESLYAELARRGHAITVYCRVEYLDGRTGAHRGIALRRAPAVRTRALDTVSHAAASVAHAIWRGGCDVVHFHALAPALLAPVCRHAGVPTVTTVQGLDWQRAKWRSLGARVLRRAERTMVRNVERVIVVSRDLQAYFARTYGRVTDLVANAIEPPAERGVDQAVLGRFGLEPSGYVLFVARLVPEKRVEDLLAAFRRVDTPCRLAIVGEGGYTDGYVARLRTATAGDPRVVFTGFQSGETLDALFRSARVYVLPSELEGQPMSLLECMAYGVPAVVSDIPPHRELLADLPGYDLFFPPRDVHALADRLARSLAGIAQYRAVASRARRVLDGSHSVRVVADATERVLGEAAAGRRA
jgi:glycosyltransferase involved in cell wall biosynthesis